MKKSYATMGKTCVFVLAFLLPHFCFAKIILPSVFSDNMVLQQNTKVKLWGWTSQIAEKITVTASWDNAPVEVDAFQGVWSVELSTPQGSFQAYQIIIKGHEQRTLKNVLVGEVWLCSGQSNMEWVGSTVMNKEEEIKNANYPNIRLFTVDKRFSETPQDGHMFPASWVACTPEAMSKFSAVGYFFARELQKSLNVPVGVIASAWGGTPIEVWIPADKVASRADIQEGAKKIFPNKWWPNRVAVAYNAMIHPLVGYAMAGVLWYQGESNRANAGWYYQTFPLLISSWRALWGKEFPFYFVQIAPFRYDKKRVGVIDGAIVRDAQLQTMKTVPNTGMVVTNDIGDTNNIHPTNKQEVGRRLALWALAKTYGREHIVYSGPIYKSKEIKGNQILIHFDYAQELTSKGEKLREFQIAGQDGVYYPAEARIKKNTVIVSSKDVKMPVHVRFAFSDEALPNLFNQAGLPASAFTTEEVSTFAK